MIESYKKVVFENYANFKGRARRSEYWYFMLANNLIVILFIVFGVTIDKVLGVNSGLGIAFTLCMVYGLLMLMPGLGVIIRRLHDVGKSGWFYLIAFIPFIGSIWLFVLFCTEGTNGINKYGADPKNIFDEVAEIGNE